MKNFILSGVVAAYLLIALSVSLEKHRRNGTPAGGNVSMIIEGAAWPITLLLEAMSKE